MPVQRSLVVRLLLVAALAAYASGVRVPLPAIPSLRVPETRVEIDEPSEELKMVVKPVVRVVREMSITDRLWLQTIYTSAAKVLRKDGLEASPVVDNTESLRKVHVSILSFVWKGLAENEPGKYVGLAEAISEAMTETIGREQRPMTPEIRERAAETFEAIAWAGLGEG